MLSSRTFSFFEQEPFRNRGIDPCGLERGRILASGAGRVFASGQDGIVSALRIECVDDHRGIIRADRVIAGYAATHGVILYPTF